MDFLEILTGGRKNDKDLVERFVCPFLHTMIPTAAFGRFLVDKKSPYRGRQGSAELKINLKSQSS